MSKTTKKTASKKTTSKKAASKKTASRKTMGVLTPLGTADWSKLPDTTKVRRTADSKMPEYMLPKVEPVLEAIGNKTMTIGALKELEYASRIWPAVNRGYLTIV